MVPKELVRDNLVDVEHDALVRAAREATDVLARVAGGVAVGEEVARGLALVAERGRTADAALGELVAAGKVGVAEQAGLALVA